MVDESGEGKSEDQKLQQQRPAVREYISSTQGIVCSLPIFLPKKFLSSFW